MGTAAKRTRANRTITIDFRDEATYFRLLEDGKAFVACVLAFVMTLGFQLKHKATCNGAGCLTRHSHYMRVCLGGGTIWRGQCTRCKAVFTVLVLHKNSILIALDDNPRSKDNSQGSQPCCRGILWQ